MKFYQKTWFIVLMFVLVWTAPVGLFLMWKYKKTWFKPIKIGLSVFYGFTALLILVGIFAPENSGTNNVSANAGGLSSSVSEEKKSEADFSDKDKTSLTTSATTTTATTATAETTTVPMSESTTATTTTTTTTISKESTTKSTTKQTSKSTAKQTTTHKTTEKKTTAANNRTPSGQKYVLNTNSHKFHYPSCASVKKISPKNYQESNASYDELISQGYVPCKNCMG